MLTHKECQSDPAIKRQILLETVERIGDRLAATATSSEEKETLAEEAVTVLDESGLLRLKLPSILGGAEADIITQMEVIEALAVADTASAWCTMVGSTSVAVLGAFLPDAGLKQVFVDGHVPRAAQSFFPAGTAVASNGGYQLSGRWRFCSGIRHSDWVSVAAIIKNADDESDRESEPPDVCFLALPTSDVNIHDNWQSMGLKGTGSCDISVDDIYVPRELTYRWDLFAPRPLRGGPLYSLPVIGFIANEHIGFALGVARRALDELINSVRNTRGVYRPNALSERQVIDRMIGKFDLELASIRALALESHRSLWEQHKAGEKIGPERYTELRSVATFATELAVRIATKAFRYGGASALYQPNILERLLRDIQAAAQHFTVGDETYEAHGRNVVGQNATG